MTKHYPINCITINFNKVIIIRFSYGSKKLTVETVNGLTTYDIGVTGVWEAIEICTDFERYS
jgi:hypothetical protein